ncbi:MAG TPA: MFS transporter [Pseudomonadales bacterium]|nr:MFS transporter [Pseudomonadales bacterium]
MLNRSFKLFWFARVASMAATQMLMVGVGWQIYDLTNSAFDLGMIGLVSFIPQVLLVLVVGQVADRFDRRNVARLCMAIEAVVVGILALGSVQGWLTRELIYALILCYASAHAFESPTLMSLLPQLVDGKTLPRAVSLSAAAMQTAIILGPAIGGWLYVAGAKAVYIAAALTYAAASLSITLIQYRPAAPAALRERPTLESLFGGVHFIRKHPIVLGAISLDLFAVLLGGATALLPIFARDILHTGPFGLGLLRTAPAVGALLMSFWLARHPITRRTGSKLFACVAGFGAATIAFGLSTHFWLTMLALLVLGATDMVSVVIRSTLIQLETPDDMRGRVNAVNSLFIGTSNQLGEFESGVVASLLGTVPAVVVGGFGTLIVAALWMKWFPELAKRDALHHIKA